MWPNPQKAADLVTFTEEILNGKLHFLCSETYLYLSYGLKLTLLIMSDGRTIGRLFDKLILTFWNNDSLLNIFDWILV